MNLGVTQQTPFNNCIIFPGFFQAKTAEKAYFLQNCANSRGKILTDNEGKMDNEQKAQKEPKKFDWVTERSSCSLPKVFHTLLLQVEQDVKTRNALRPQNSPYEFSIEENGSDFKVVLAAGELRNLVIFTLAEHGILVRGGEGNQMFEVTLNFSVDGKCHLVVNDQQLDSWQVRRMALEELFFHGQ